jgi:hypothetical protein
MQKQWDTSRLRRMARSLMNRKARRTIFCLIRLASRCGPNNDFLEIAHQQIIRWKREEGRFKRALRFDQNCLYDSVGY